MKSVRLRLIIRVLSETGCRLGELIGLRVGDLITNDGNHFSLASREDRRQVGCHPAGWPTSLAAVPGDRLTTSLFSWLSGAAMASMSHLRRAGVQQMIRSLSHDAGIRRRVHPHLFRHTYGTEFIAQGGHSVMLAKILGHHSLSMIKTVYAHPRQSHIAQAMLEHLRRVESRRDA